jgi:menaquinone-dependent protoporphyrinogen oxidase
MAQILIIYASVDGQTRKICQHIEQILCTDGHCIQLQPLEETVNTDLPAYDQLIIGASIRYGRHNPLVVKLIQQHTSLLRTRPWAFFSVNLTARKPEKCQPKSNPYLCRMLKSLPCQPDELAVFAGMLNYPAYSAIDRLLIRMIMWITGGPTDPATVMEYTDWMQVEGFARRISLQAMRRDLDQECAAKEPEEAECSSATASIGSSVSRSR